MTISTEISTENSTENPNHTETTSTQPGAAANSTSSLLTNWRSRLDELFAVKSVDELKSELTKLASEVQEEIQKFDINSHLSPEAKEKLKSLETTYAEILKGLHKLQKQFDREFNKTLRVLNTTRKDAEKHISGLRAKVAKHRNDLEKATKKLRGTLKSKAKKVKIIRKTKKSAK